MIGSKLHGRGGMDRGKWPGYPETGESGLEEGVFVLIGHDNAIAVAVKINALTQFFSTARP